MEITNLNGVITNDTFVEDIKNRIYECSDYKNRCDYLMEHDECTHLLDYIEQLEKCVKDNQSYINYLVNDKLTRLEREIKIKDAWANEIKCNLWGYDGCENSIPGLRGLVDEAIDDAEKIMSCDDKSIVISGFKCDEHGNKYAEHRNVLDEVLTEFTEEDQKIINWFRGEDNESN